MKSGNLAVVLLLASSAASAQAPAASPLSVHPGFGHNRAADEARYIREEGERERLIATCMKTAGFRYNPAPAVSVSGPMLNTSGKGQGPIDQNERYARSLTATEREKYYLALYGVPDPNDPANLWSPSSATGGGCAGEALRAIPGVYAARSALAEEYETMLRLAREDSRVKGAEATWATCVKERGLQFSSPSDAYADLDANPSGASARRAIIEECGQRAALNETAAQVRSEHEAEFVEKHAAILTRWEAKK